MNESLKKFSNVSLYEFFEESLKTIPELIQNGEVFERSFQKFSEKCMELFKIKTTEKLLEESSTKHLMKPLEKNLGGIPEAIKEELLEQLWQNSFKNLLQKLLKNLWRNF